MSLPAIEISGLSKRYVIQHESQHDNLRDTLHHTARKLWRRMRWGTDFRSEEFWALRDVSFAVQPGEVVGIIGRNGAGKSTLLKILSRITEPTAGRITLRGRVASLLEVGTGFHPDLSGRENIYLNGAILGMSRVEIRRKFDEIVAFAEVERFLDTPVKRYSSGMYVRLAFAVAAHLEPEILIVDEVLAVGDAAFQKKCLGKMQDIARGQGRTVLLVSHNMDSIRRLCTNGLVLEAGRRIAHGPIAECLAHYQNQSTQDGAWQNPNVDQTGPRLLAAQLDPAALEDDTLDIVIHFELDGHVARPELGLVVATITGQPVFGTNSQLTPWSTTPPANLRGPQSARLRVPRLSLWSGSYVISLWLSDGGQTVGQAENALGFDYLAPPNPAPVPHVGMIGALRVAAEWTAQHPASGLSPQP